MFALVVLALSAVVTVSPESLAKGMVATVLGLMLATVGIDQLMPVPRFTFGSIKLLVGVPLIPVVIGPFAVSELLHQAGEPERVAEIDPDLVSGRPAEWWADVRAAGCRTFASSSVIGTLVGALPGAGGPWPRSWRIPRPSGARSTPSALGPESPRALSRPRQATTR